MLLLTSSKLLTSWKKLFLCNSLCSSQLPAEPSFEEYRNVKKKHRPKLYGDFDGPHGTVKGGMGRIVEEVMRREPRLEEKLLLGNVVEEIDYR